MKFFHLKFLIITLSIPLIMPILKINCLNCSVRYGSTSSPRIERIIDGCMKDEENVFLETFSTIYQDLIKESLLHIQGPLNIFLQNAFDQEKKRLIKKHPTDSFFSAKFNEEVVGYISFSNDDETNAMYINQLAVIPKFSKQGIG
jgi:hypothetical protein